MLPDFGHEANLRRWVKEGLSGHGGVFIDVGAELGVWTIDMAPVFDVVYAVEPFFTDQLGENLKNYNIHNAIILDFAAWDFNGQVLIGKTADIPGTPGSQVMVGGLDKLVKAQRLDDVVDKPFRLLKVDVEGGGVNVLNGMLGLLEKSSGMSIIEVHNHGESHGTYLIMQKYGWKLINTFNERHDNNWYHAYKVYIK